MPLLVALAAVLGLVGSAGGGVPVPPPPGDMLPTWSPDGTAIVFLSDRNGLSLRVMSPDGSGVHQIAWLPASSSYSFSRDWSHVAAYADGQVVVERLDGTDRLSVGRAAYLTRPSWSPDGTRVAFTAPSAAPNQADVVVARIDGSDTHLVAAGAQPAWAPAGERIAYVAGEYGKNELHLVNADGSGDVRLASGGVYSQPGWSPDGTRLAVVHQKPGEFGSTLQILRDDGGRVASFRVTPSDYAWSPRGDAIAYSNGAGLWLVDVASGRKRRLATFGYGVAWSPDAGQVAFAAGGECRNRMGIYRVEVATRQPVRLTNDCRVLGTAGDDVLMGTPLADVLLGEGGNDTLRAVAGYFVGDTLVGGPGNDLLVGSVTSDTLDGGPGDDVLRGGPAPDLLIGGAGRDVIRGQGGRDLIRARDGRRDVVSCGTNTGRTTGPEGDVAYVRPLRRRLARLRVGLPAGAGAAGARSDRAHDQGLAAGEPRPEEPAARVLPALPAGWRDAPARRVGLRPARPRPEPVRPNGAARALRAGVRRRPDRRCPRALRRPLRPRRLRALQLLRRAALGTARVPFSDSEERPGLASRPCWARSSSSARDATSGARSSGCASSTFESSPSTAMRTRRGSRRRTRRRWSTSATQRPSRRSADATASTA